MNSTPKISNLCHSKLTARGFAALALISLTFSSTAHAATETWDGGHGSVGAWYANLNWADDTAPVDGDDLVFTGTTRLNHLAYANWGGDNDAQINSITFASAAGAFVIGDAGGGTYKMLGDITNNSTSLQTINFPFQLNADVTANAAAGDITIGGVISEDGSARSLIKSGSNTLSLTGASTYTGTTDINAGKLQLGNGGTTGSLSTSSAIDIASNAAFMVNRTNTVTQGTDFSSAAITGAGYIVSAGDGTLVLNRANSHTGGARIGIDNTTSESATRVLQVTHSDALGTGTLGFWKSGTFELGADALTVTNNVFSGNYSAPGNDKIIKLDLAGAATGTLSGDFDTRGGNFESFKMDVGAADTLTLSGNIYNGAGGGAGITKIGDGTLIMSGTNTYDGTTRVNAGTLKLSGGSAIEDVRDVYVDASGTLDLNGSNETINRLTGTGTIDNTASNGILTVGHNSATFQFDGTLTDTVGSLRLTKVGTGTLTLTGANTHTFTQIGVTGGVTAGTVSIENNAALGTGNLSYEAGGTLQLGVNGLSVANGIFVGNRADTAARTIQLDLDGSNTGELTGNIDIRVDQVGEFVADVGTDDTLTFSGNLVTGAGGNAGLTKAGAGTLVLEGTNTYKGPTTVSSGMLIVNGNSSGVAGNVSIASGATLGGSGTIGGATTIQSGGFLAPGNSPGILTFSGALTLASGSFTNMEITGGTRGTDYDGIDVGGALTYGGGLTLTSNTLIGVGTYDLFDFTSESGDFTSIILSGTAYASNAFIQNGDVWDAIVDNQTYTFSQVTGNLVVATTAVPEPETFALLGGLLALGYVMLRRRR